MYLSRQKKKRSCIGRKRIRFDGDVIVHGQEWMIFSFRSMANALEQLMRNGFELRNLYIVCVLFETIRICLIESIDMCDASALLVKRRA